MSAARNTSFYWNMKSYISTVIILLSTLAAHAQIKPSETAKDWKPLAEEMTFGISEKYYQAELIYRWLCDNIAYDTYGKIHTADESFAKRKASCMGFCELFYRMSEAVGLQSTIVIGKSKEIDGTINHDTQAWIIAETERGKILIEPAWGAGLVIDGRFIRTPNNMAWFDVDPFMMITTHLPVRKQDQLIDDPIDEEQFKALPYINATLGKYGLKGSRILADALQGKLHLPRIYGCLTNDMMVSAIPVEGRLKAGERYLFEAVDNDVYDYIIRIDDIDIAADQWIENSYSKRAEFVVAGTRKVMIYIIDRNAPEGEVAAAFEYGIDTDGVEIEELAVNLDPYMNPELQTIGNLKINLFKRIGIDGRKLLDELHSTGSTNVPEFYIDHDKLEIISIPLHSPLHIGQEYTFEFRSKTESEWKIDNSGTWFDDWNLKEKQNGIHKITVKPKNIGYLAIILNFRNNEYVQVIKYAVTR